MRPSPQWTEARRYPVISATILLAVVASVRWWTGGSIDLLVEDAGIQRGQVWRLLTSTLPHVNLLHLAFNLYWLWALGTIVEEAFGHARTAATLAFFGVGSAAADYAILDGGVGLSGVGYGLFGLLWVLHRRDPRFADAMDQRTTTLFVAWFFICIATTVAGIMSVGNIAHGVGALLGILLGHAILPSSRRSLAKAGMAILTIAFVAGAIWLRPYMNCSAEAGRDEAHRGYEALMADRNDEAVGWCRLATRLSPRTASYWTNLGIALQRVGQSADADTAYDRATQLESHQGRSQ